MNRPDPNDAQACLVFRRHVLSCMAPKVAAAAKAAQKQLDGAIAVFVLDAMDPIGAGVAHFASHEVLGGPEVEAGTDAFLTFATHDETALEILKVVRPQSFAEVSRVPVPVGMFRVVTIAAHGIASALAMIPSAFNPLVKGGTA